MSRSGRYKHQILYGCENPNCRTPTCWNYQRRVSEGPFRPYTELSARTLACYLASQDNPEKGFCRNPPRLPTDFPPTRQAPHAEYKAYSSRRKTHQSENAESEANADTQRHSSSTSTAPPPPENVRHHSRDSHLSRTKDPKSFTQNLFDTLSLRMVEWLPLRQTTTDAPDCATPNAVRPYKNQAHLGESKEREGNDQTRRTCINAPSNNISSCEPTTPSGRPKRRSNSNLDRKSTTQTLKRVTLEDTDTWRPTPRSSTEIKSRDVRSTTSRTAPTRTYSQHHIPTPPPALKHRAAKANKASADSTTKPPKQSRRVSWDGSKLLRESAELSDVNDDTTEKETPDSLSPEVPDLRLPSVQSIPYQATSVDTVSHLNAEIVEGLFQLLAQNERDAQKWKEEIDYMNAEGKFDNHNWRHATPRQREVFPFVAQSVFYGLNNSRQLRKSFRRKRSSQHSQNPTEGITVDLQTLESTLRKLQAICPCDLVLNSLWNSLEQLFIPPRDMPMAFRASRRVSYIQPETLLVGASPPSTPDEPLSDADAAHMLTVVFFALITFLPKVDGQTWRGIQQIREAGTVLPEAQMQKLNAKSTALVLDVTDKLEHDLALRLVHRLVRALTARLAFYEISKAKTLPSVDVKKRRDKSVLDLLFDNLREHHESLKQKADTGGETVPLDTPVAAAMIVEWIRTLFLKEWDGKPEILRSEAAGGAIQILSSMYKNRQRLGLEADAFYTSFLSERLDAMEMPVEWLNRASNNRTMHLLSFTFLFRPAALVKYFRAINYAAMSKAYEAGMIAQRQASRTAFNRTIQIADEINLLARLHTSMNQYFVISVRREQVLQDAFNQIWRRERRELLRPLKVKLGADLGEEGVDLGGVQQEFMTMAFAEAMNPEHGMFTVDPTTRMAWFQPCSPESLEHFELVGILMSLAIYNGLTIPVTFPLALYRKLLDLKIKRTEHIRDGWPDLAKGLESLLTWDDGDVGDVFVRSYEFSFEVFGSVQTVDMQRTDRDAEWPVFERVPSRERRRSSISNYSTGVQGEKGFSEEVPEEKAGNGFGSFQTGILKGEDYNTSLNTFTPQEDTEESSLVTNANREQYVKDYLFWLTDKSVRPQYEAFARGFFTCIDRPSLSLFTPEILQTVVEGTQEIDIEELQRHATYDGGWDGKHPLITSFWNIVKKYSREQKARLLEFVTATDRVPVSGISSINFVIQRNGSGNDVSSFSLSCER